LERGFVEVARSEHQAPALGDAKQLFACVEGGEGVLQGAGAVGVERALYCRAQLQVAGVQQRARLQRAERAVVFAPFGSGRDDQSLAEVGGRSVQVRAQERTLRPAKPLPCCVQGVHEAVGQRGSVCAAGCFVWAQEKAPAVQLQVAELSAGVAPIRLRVLALRFFHRLRRLLGCLQGLGSGSPPG
jgi:hypothetical protein